MSEVTESCRTCYGTGQIVGEHGPEGCPDCYGDGRAASAGSKLEWRLRELERSYRGTNREVLGDMMWLVHELRQARDALTLILTRCQDADEQDEVARYVRSQAMAALGLLPRFSGAAGRGREGA